MTHSASRCCKYGNPLRTNAAQWMMLPRWKACCLCRASCDTSTRRPGSSSRVCFPTFSFMRRRLIILAQTTTIFLQTTSARRIQPRTNSYKWRMRGLLPKRLEELVVVRERMVVVAVRNLGSPPPLPGTITTQIAGPSRTAVRVSPWRRTRRAWQAHRVTEYVYTDCYISIIHGPQHLCGVRRTPTVRLRNMKRVIVGTRQRQLQPVGVM